MQQMPKAVQTCLVISTTLVVGVVVGALAVSRSDQASSQAPVPTANTATETPAVATLATADVAESADATNPNSVDAGTKAFVQGAYAFAPGASSPSASDQSVNQLQGKLMPSVELLRDRLQLPPLAEGVTDLRFNEFFEKPGDYGLEYTAKIKSLDSKKVRLLGFMVNRCAHSPGLFLLTSMPVTTHEHEMGLADDLPIATVHVFMPASPVIAGDSPRTRRMGVVPAEHKYGEALPGTVPWTPGLLLLTGTLRTGTRDEADGRISTARLELDELPPGSPVRWGNWEDIAKVQSAAPASEASATEGSAAEALAAKALAAKALAAKAIAGSAMPN